MAEDLPVLPWKRARQAPPKRVALSRDMIVDTAIRLLDQDGLDGVSMRRVAEQLGTGPASLYAHVANKEELLDLMHDRVMSEIEVPQPDPARWQEQLRDVLLHSSEVLEKHRDVARLSLANVPTGQNALRISEGIMAIMLAGGVPPQVAAFAVDRLALYIAADAYEGSLFVRQWADSGVDQNKFVTDHRESVRSFFRALPADRFPLLNSHADVLTGGTREVRREFGLDMLIRSLATYVEPKD
jgi:AcrR family transcriptional regulator